jgi:hypothetical protein
MRHLLLAVGLAIGASTLVLAQAGAGPPLAAPLAITASGQPVAGKTFTGLLISNREAPGAYLTGVTCDAKVGKRRLQGHRQRFYATGYTNGPAAITCSWNIPADATGKKLLPWGANSTVYFQQHGTEEFHFSWRIRK